MENSFYYFFSAVPQVLGGLIALFGVFVIFKIQNTFTILKEIAQSVYDMGSKKIRSSNDKFTKRLSDASPLDEMKKAIERNDISNLKSILDDFTHKDFDSFKEKFFKELDNVHVIIKFTIYWSIFTAVLIIASLIILSQGSYLTCHPVLMQLIFWIVNTLLVVCFAGLVYLLRKSILKII